MDGVPLLSRFKNDFMPKDRIQTLWLLLGAVGFVLLIACVNVANLLLSKGAARLEKLRCECQPGRIAPSGLLTVPHGKHPFGDRVVGWWASDWGPALCKAWRLRFQMALYRNEAKAA